MERRNERGTTAEKIQYAKNIQKIKIAEAEKKKNMK